MANVKISALPNYTGASADLRWFVMNNSGETETFKYSGYSSPYKYTNSTFSSNNTYDTNPLPGSYNKIIGGENHSVQGNYNAVVGGYGHNFANIYSSNLFVGGGLSHTFEGGDRTASIGGYGNYFYGGEQNYGVGGLNNQIFIGNNSGIIGGENCSVYTAFGTKHNGVYSGAYNKIITDAKDYNTIINGSGNTISGSSYYSTILNGSGNIIGSYSGVSMLSCFGRTADASNTTYVENLKAFGNITNTGGTATGLRSIVGGNNSSSSCNNSIVWGNNNIVNAGGESSSAVFGSNNSVNTGGAGGNNLTYGAANTNTGYYSIVGGEGSSTNQNNSAVFGYAHTNTGSRAAILGGTTNNNTGSNSAIIAGTNNNILGSTDSAIVGSYNSIIRAVGRNGIFASYQGEITQSPNYQSVIMASAYSNITYGNATAIIGGYSNIIDGINNNESIIIGGKSNTLTSTLDGTILNGVSNSLISSPLSSIIGGSGNTISGKTNVVMVGTSGRTADYDNTTYVENLKVHRQIYGGIKDLGTAGSGNLNIDCNEGNIQYFTISATSYISFASSTIRDGATYILKIKQPSGTTYTATWNPLIKFPNGIAPTLSTTPNAEDILTFVVIGGEIYGNIQKAFA